MRLITAVALACLCASGTAAADADRDSLPDALEQELLERFLPRFMISARDCDVRPSEFRAGHSKPRAVSRNGTIYGQAFPAGPGEIELHFYHLWAKDCGLAPHPLDAEYVSALLREAAPGKWRAVYWYAGAHEATICDASNGARADAIDGVDRGPAVWISDAKHATYLDRERCRRGCGGDRCESMILLAPPRVVNLGEPGRPLNGAEWTASGAWPLAAKMTPDFTPEVRAQLDAAGGVVAVNRSIAPVKAVVLAGTNSVDAVALANTTTDRAVATSHGHTVRALGRAARAVGRWLGAGK
ncbi:MAG: hypothetical protein IPM24_20845 [Bryobacterales bacterium]|nr:hypothetical protein [Bryobacterales bacterium]